VAFWDSGVAKGGEGGGDRPQSPQKPFSQKV
jgi:hypothetical protein